MEKEKLMRALKAINKSSDFGKGLRELEWHKTCLWLLENGFGALSFSNIKDEKVSEINGAYTCSEDFAIFIICTYKKDFMNASFASEQFSYLINTWLTNYKEL